MVTKKSEIKKLRGQVQVLKRAFDDVIWMAIRYANNRNIFAPGMVRDACEARASCGQFYLKPDITLDPPPHILPPSVFDSDNLRDVVEKYCHPKLFWTPLPRADGRMEWTCIHGVGHGNHVHGCCHAHCCGRKDYPGRGKK